MTCLAAHRGKSVHVALNGKFSSKKSNLGCRVLNCGDYRRTNRGWFAFGILEGDPEEKIAQDAYAVVVDEDVGL